MSVKMSLRERKKLATRTALIATARLLFAEKGYENVTLEEICDEIPVHVTTFFSYFDSKEELAFAHQLDALEAFRQSLRERSPDTSVMDLWWRFRDDFGQQDRGEEATILLRMDNVPALRSRQANIVRQYVEEISRALSEEAGGGVVDDLHAYLYASALMAVHVDGARWYGARYGRDIEKTDTAGLAKLIMSKFPSRDEIGAEFNRLRRSAAAKSRAKKKKEAAA